MKNPEIARLILEDGKEYPGKPFGAVKPVAGEVVFNTAMTGYPESLTDPSFKGQILVSTYPLIGNYGVPEFLMQDELPAFFESDRVQVSGLVVQDYSFDFSHWNAGKSLDQWLKEFQVPGITGIDTRALTRHIREFGVMSGKIVYESSDEVEFYDPNQENLVARVSCDEVKTYGSGTHNVAVIDCGVKANIIRCLLKRDTTVIRVPWDYDISGLEVDGVLISNGPGDPTMAKRTIETVRSLLEGNKPVFGICLGSQLMALSAEAKTYKLKYGHRGHNQPVQQVGTRHCYITAQNHGYAIDTATLNDEWEIFFENVNDQTCEGIRHKYKPFFAVQFHPEASGGPVETEFLFDDFIKHIQYQKG
ncbi:MAG: glutamine-hydrolyzing carbamoyl-phosphate synthase small subunit [Calditrichia bacterium]